MHLLLVHQNYASPGQSGGTRHQELAARLVERGHQVTIVTSQFDYLTGRRVTAARRWVAEEEHQGVRVLRCYALPWMHRSYTLRVAAFLSFMLTSFWVALRVPRVDVVMGTSPPIFQLFSTWVVALLRRKPYLVEIRDLWPEFAVDMGVLKNPLLIALARWGERFIYARASHLLVNSPAYRDYLLAKGVAEERIRVIPNGVDWRAFDPDADGGSLREKLGMRDAFLVVYAGALGAANDLSTLLRAADRLREDRHIHLLLVGDGKERARLETLAAELRLNNVTFAGAFPKDQMKDVLAAADACVATLCNIPMFRTTYPNKVFDYLAAGRPIVLGIDGVIREVVEAAGGGLFVPPGDDAALAAAIRRLAENREQARAMGRAGRAYVVEHFDRRQHAENLERLLLELAGKSPAPDAHESVVSQLR